jgi:phospholipase C
VKHVVILTQENRSFDNYFGTLKRVRGFGDRFTIPLTQGVRYGNNMMPIRIKFILII